MLLLNFPRLTPITSGYYFIVFNSSIFLNYACFKNSIYNAHCSCNFEGISIMHGKLYLRYLNEFIRLIGLFFGKIFTAIWEIIPNAMTLFSLN